MKRHLSMLLLCAWTVSLLVSCGKGRKGLLTSVSTGRPYEVLVVAETDFWDRPAGKALYRVLDTDVPGLPQSERSFRLMRTSPDGFDATLRLVRNIIVLEVDAAKYSQAAFRYAKDVYASPQVILTLQAPDEVSLAAFVEAHGASLVRFLTQVEMNRSIRALSEEHNMYVSAAVQRLFGGDIWLPAELVASKEGTGFFWAGTNAATDDRNFVMYSYPYAGGEALTKAGFVCKRDSVMKVNIPGARSGMYMATDSLMTDVRLLQLRGRQVMEVRGLWYMKGDFMGGPFVAHVRVDEARRRMVVAEVFVYAPGRLKRDLMRGMEASLYTWRLSGETENEIINHKE